MWSGERGTTLERDRESPQTVRSVEGEVREERRTAAVVVVDRGTEMESPTAVQRVQDEQKDARRMEPVEVVEKRSPLPITVLPPLAGLLRRSQGDETTTREAHVPSLGYTRLPLATGKKGERPEQYYILCALYQSHPGFRDAAQWLKPKFKDDLEAGRYRAVDYRKFGVKLGGNVIVQRQNRQLKNCGTKHHLQDVKRFRKSSREGVVFRCVLNDEDPGFMHVHVERKMLLQQTCMDCKKEMERRLTCVDCIESGKKKRGCGACKWKQEGRKKKLCQRESLERRLNPLQVLTAVASRAAIEDGRSQII